MTDFKCTNCGAPINSSRCEYCGTKHYNYPDNLRSVDNHKRRESGYVIDVVDRIEIRDLFGKPICILY